MSQAVHRRMHLTLNTDGRLHPLENGLAFAVAALGLMAVTAAFSPSAHVIGSWAGLAGFVTGVVGQYLSATTAERWVIIIGWGASAIGLAFGLAHGGLW